MTESQIAPVEPLSDEARFRLLAETMPQKIFTARPNGEVDRPLELQAHPVANLLSNAIKYSPSGGQVTVTVASEQDDEESWATLMVRSGSGGQPNP